jgi:nucleoside-diphosphate kinase
LEYAIAIMGRYTDEGLVIQGIKFIQMDEKMARLFYRDHVEKPYFKRDIVPAMTAGRTVALIVAGNNAISEVRRINGATEPSKANPETIRRIFGLDLQHNSVHGSDSQEASDWEICVMFG